jgi:Flp pilus assembly protein TadD
MLRAAAQPTVKPPPAQAPGARALTFTGSRAAIALVVVVVAAFLPVGENGFVSLDDKKNFLENASFRGLGKRQVAWALTTPHVGVYEPLGWMLLETQYEAWGLNPRGYHLASLALYTLTAIALYALTVTLLARGRPGLWRHDPGLVRACACLAVGLYAAHPLRVQVVAWASCQSYVACGLFSVLTLLAYLRAQSGAPRVHRGWLAGCFLLYTAALLCKAPAVTLPAVFLILDVYPLGRLGPGRWRTPEALHVYREKVPFLALSAIFTALAVWARSLAVGAAGDGAQARVARACYSAVFYLSKTVAPVRISPCYPLPLRMTLTEPRFLLSAVFVAVVSAFVVAARRRLPAALVAWVVYLVMLAPSSGLFRTGGAYVAADRYGFMPTMGLAVLAAAALCGIGGKLGNRRAGRAITLGIFVGGTGIGLALVAMTRAECRAWHDSETLWSHALAASTEPNPFACHGLALVLAGEQGRLAQAESLLHEALRAVPDDPSLHNALTTVLAKQSRAAEALAHAQRALRIAPKNVAARVNLGNLLALKGDGAGAKAAYEAALLIDPNDADAHANLGMVLAAEGRADQAQAHLVAALLHNPSLSQARRALVDLRRRQP